VGVQTRTITIATTIILGVAINLVTNLVTNHFSWPLMIVLGAATLSLIGVELRLTRPVDTVQMGRPTGAVSQDGDRSDATFAGALPPPAATSRLIRLLLTVFVVAAVVGVIVLRATGKSHHPIRPGLIEVESDPYAVAITPDGQRAYVASPSRGYVADSSHSEPGGTVWVIDTASNTVTATIPVGGDFARDVGVAITPDGRHAYITGGNEVSVIDTASNAVTVTIPVSGEDVAITPDGRHAYITGDQDILGNRVSVIDTASNTVTATITLNFLWGQTTDVAITPDGHYAYITCKWLDKGYPSVTPSMVAVIDTASNVVTSTIPFPNVVATRGPERFDKVAITPDGHHGYITSAQGTLSVVDTASNTVTTTIGVGRVPVDMAITPDGRHAYITNKEDNDDGTVLVIDTASNAITAVIPVGKKPSNVAITPDGHHAYITNIKDRTISVIKIDGG
jgi:YVTN family beta-propeller protein